MSTPHATDAVKQSQLDEIKDWISEQRGELSRLEDTVDDMISCTSEVTKNGAPAQVLQDYRLVFEDDFNQAPGSTLDYSKWNTSLPWGPSVIINSEDQVYIDTKNGMAGPNPFDFDGNGNLLITASELPSGESIEGKRFTSGVITTFDSLNFVEGYAEICQKQPCNTIGLWSAFWALNRYYQPAPQATGANGKFEPEIDWEFVRGPGGLFGGGPYDTSCALAAYHYDDGNWKIDANGFAGRDPATNQFTLPAVSQQCDGTILGTGFNPPMGFDPVCNFGDFCEAFHIFGFWRTEEFIRYYVDGVEVHSICDPNIVSQVPMYIIANQAVGGAFPGNPDPATYPSILEIDYIRIYTP